MRGLFDKIELKNQSTMSKSDKKKYNSFLGNVLDLKKEYKIHQISSRLKLIKDDSKYLFFEYYDKIYPTVKNFNRDIFKTVFLDEGAIGPLSRGADVMAPGIIKYKDMSANFKKDDVVGVEIRENGIFAVGKALMDFEEMLLKAEGPVIEIFHTKGDSLDLQ